MTHIFLPAWGNKHKYKNCSLSHIEFLGERFCKCSKKYFGQKKKRSEAVCTVFRLRKSEKTLCWSLQKHSSTLCSSKITEMENVSILIFRCLLLITAEWPQNPPSSRVVVVAEVTCTYNTLLKHEIMEKTFSPRLFLSFRFWIIDNHNKKTYIPENHVHTHILCQWSADRSYLIYPTSLQYYTGSKYSEDNDNYKTFLSCV